MKNKVKLFKAEVKKAADNPEFIHRQWFVKYHLEIVEKIAKELLGFYPAVDKNLVEVLVWLHDYGKILDFDHQDEAVLTAGRQKLTELGLKEEFVDRVIKYAELMDKSTEIDLGQAPVEVQIVSSADGCAHMVGPFMSIWWQENSNKSVESLMADTRRKLDKDWNRKITLPEARKDFEQRYNFILEQSGNFSDNYLANINRTTL